MLGASFDPTHEFAQLRSMGLASYSADLRFLHSQADLLPAVGCAVEEPDSSLVNVEYALRAVDHKTLGRSILGP